MYIFVVTLWFSCLFFSNLQLLIPKLYRNTRTANAPVAVIFLAFSSNYIIILNLPVYFFFSLPFVCWYYILLLYSFLRYTRVNKNPSAWNFLSPKPEVTCGTVAIIIPVVLLSPYLRIRAVSLSSIHYNQSHRIYINRRRQYFCLIWN